MPKRSAQPPAFALALGPAATRQLAALALWRAFGGYSISPAAMRLVAVAAHEGGGIESITEQRMRDGGATLRVVVVAGPRVVASDELRESGAVPFAPGRVVLVFAKRRHRS